MIAHRPWPIVPCGGIVAQRRDRVHGIFNIDKPAGMTSHDVVDAVRRLVRQRRVGHAGTLDPLATGVLVVCVGNATRLVEYMVGHDKEYRVTVRLGVETDTYDAEGTIVAQRPVPPLSVDHIETVLARFRGEIHQTPPRFSAIRRGGKRLYDLARAGVEVEAPTRRVSIYALDLEAWQPPDLTLRVVCSAGTYVRSLAHDIGRALGTGGHVIALRRLRSGPFRVEDAVPLDALLAADDWRGHLLPPDAGLVDWPRLDLAPAQAEDVRHGRFLRDVPPVPNATWARAYVGDRFLAVLQWDEKRRLWRPKKVLG